MQVLPISFAGMLCFGITNCLWRPAYRSMERTHVLFYRSVLTVLLLSVWLMGYHVLGNVPPPDIFRTNTFEYGAWILLSFAGLLLLTRSLMLTPAGISGSVVMALSLFGALVAHFFRGEPWPGYLLHIVYLYVVGLALIDKSVLRTFVPDRATLLALGAAACWALANIGFKKGIGEVGAYTFAWMQELVVLILSGAWLLIRKGTGAPVPEEMDEQRSRAPIVLLAVLTVGGIVCTNLAIERLTLMQFAWISMVQPVATVVVSKWVQREEMSIRQLLGAAFLMAGAFLTLV